MSDNKGEKLKLNLNAKEFKPKFMTQNQNPQPMQNQYNMGYDMNSPYGYMNYGGPYGMQGMQMGPYGGYGYNQNNQPQFPNQNMQQPQQAPMQNPQTPPPQQPPQPQHDNDDGIVGLKKKKKKKKGGDAQAQQNQGSSNNANQLQNQNQVKTNNQNQINFGNNQINNYNQGQNQKKPQKPKEKTEKKEEKPKKKEDKKEGKDSSSNNNINKKKEDKKEKDDSSNNNNLAKGGSQKIIEGTDLVEDSFEGKMISVDTTHAPVSIVFVGHVDSGKSTISGSLLYSLGEVDERIIDKYKREARVKNRESWFMAYIMDTYEEEREKGKTVDIGKASFSTPHRRFTLLDAPGHSGYIPNLLLGACQADVAGLVISAKKGEFESGFDKQGSTREHTLLLKALGVNNLIVMVNKMDEDSVKWSKERYEEIVKQLKPFIHRCGFDIEKNVKWIPISGLTGENLCVPLDKHKCDWYDGPDLIQLMDTIELPKRDEKAPVRLSILDRYKENSVYIMGKLESGTIKYGDTYTLMPSKAKITVDWLFNSEEKGVPYALPGENIRIRCKGIDSESEVNRGNILCSNDNLCLTFNVFEAEIHVLELPNNLIIAEGFNCILHYHTFIEECSITPKTEINVKTKAETKVKFVRSQSRIKAYVKTKNVLCGEKYETFNNLGRFSMRYEGSTIAIGKIMKVKPYKKEDTK
jgi:peptide chain release factor subunit 3